MDKIYSRKKIKIPKVILYGAFQNKNNDINKRFKKVFKIVIIVTIAIVTMVRCIKGIEPVFDKICETQAKGIATQISNNKATEVMKKYEYEDLATIIRDGSGNVIMVQSNIIPINKIISDVAVEIQTELDNMKNRNIKIKAGILTGSRILSGMGPEINLKVSGVGDVVTDFRSEFKQSGINQTLHRLYLQVECKINMLTPFNTIEETVTNQVILAENIIVGTTPSTYYNFDGISHSEQVMDIIE